MDWGALSDAWNAATSGDWSGAASSVGNAFSGDSGGTPLAAAPDAGSYGAMDLGGAAGSSALGSLGDFASGQGMAGLQSGAQNFSNIGDFGGGAPSAMGGVASDAAPTSWGGENFPSNTNSGVASGIADSGGAGLLSQANDFAKKNSSLINPLVQAGLTLGRSTSPAPATTAGYNAAAAANAQNAAVGNSLINQAPGLATNAEAASKGAGANASSALQTRLEQQGYKPGDAMYESAMQQQNLGNRSNDTTAYAAGQGQMANMMGTGAGLLTPTNLSAYDSLGSQQNAQQGAQNKANAGLAGAATQAFNIYNTPDSVDQTFKPAKTAYDSGAAAPAAT